MEERVPKAVVALQARVAQLTERERKLLLLLGLVAVVFLLMLGNLFVGNAFSAMRDGNEDRRAALDLLITERERFLFEQEQARSLDARLDGNQLRLSSFVETTASQSGVPRPREFRDHSQPVGQTGVTSIETTVSFPSMSFEQLIDLLNAFEDSGELVFIQSLRITPARRGEHGLDADITLATYRRTGEP